MSGTRRFSTLWLAGLLALGGGSASHAAAPAEPQPDEAPAAWIGVFIGDALDGGVQLVAVAPDGPAARAGLRPGDVLVRAGESYLLDVSDLTQLLEGLSPGEPLRLELLRAGRPLERAVRPLERPARRALFGRPSPAADPPAALRAPAPPAVGCRAYGLRLAEVTPDLRRHYGAPADAGLLVTGLDPRLPAAADGFRVGDVLVRIAEQPVRELAEVERLLLTGEPELGASLVRGGIPTELTLRTDGLREGLTPSTRQATRHSPLEESPRKELERLERRLEELRRLLGAEQD